MNKTKKRITQNRKNMVKKGEKFHVHTEENSIISKMSAYPILIYQAHAIPIKIPASCFMDINNWF